MSAQQHGFKAEVQQLLHLMIHSVYSDREVFLRELVSNAADALDKARFIGLTREDLTPAAHEDAGVRILLDPAEFTLTLEDDGVGMTEEEVVDNLGTIARSGTRAFLEQLKSEGKGDQTNLIGQFGLGFYSAFMVADHVVVNTRSVEPGAAAVRWSSHGEGTFEVGPSEREHRGTSITLHLREDCRDFVEKAKLEAIIRKHSNFLPWPIFVAGTQANTGKALWAERPSEVDDEEAAAFYKQVSNDWRDPIMRVHASVDTPLQYHAMLFVPEARPYDLFHPEAPRGPRLYARRVLIEEHARHLLPEWLRFVRGVVDSEDIPLNVSREMVQQTAIVQKIKAGLTKRILKELGKFAEEHPTSTDDKPGYDTLWKSFGVLLKEGYYHDADRYSDLLLPLFRFNALSHDDAAGLKSLADYKSEMKEGQDAIWYLSAESRGSALTSPHLEALRKRGWDVLLLTDTVDEWLVGSLTEFDGVPLKNVARGDFDVKDDDDDTTERADLTGLGPWLNGLLAGAVAEVRPSNRLTDSPCVLVDADHGLSSNMERILRAANQDVPGASARVLELNPTHPLIRNLAQLHANGREAAAEPLARLLYDDALLLEGSVKEPAAMGKRLQALLLSASEAALN